MTRQSPVPYLIDLRLLVTSINYEMLKRLHFLPTIQLPTFLYKAVILIHFE
jgi:hypothetical protein